MGFDVSDYVTDAELRAWLGITDQDDKTAIKVAVTTASRHVDAYCGRKFSLDAGVTTRLFYPETSHQVSVDDIATTSGLVVAVDTGDDGVADTTWTTNDYQLEPINLEEGWPYTRIRAVEGLRFPLTGHRPTVHISAQWGWPAVPEPVKNATLIVAARFYRRRNTPEGFSAGEAFGAIRVSSRMDPDAQMMLGPFRAVGGSGLVVA
jgi:hypothetical protein